MLFLEASFFFENSNLYMINPRIPVTAEIMKNTMAFLRLLSPSAPPERVEMIIEGRRARVVITIYVGILIFVRPMA